MYQKTTALNKILKLKKRIRGISGGTSASKTISILQILCQYAQTTENETLSVVSETMPHLRKGAMRDFENIMKEHGYWVDSDWNATNSVYTFNRPDNKGWKPTIIEFFSADQPQRVRGPRRDVLFINEANNVSFETYTQLEIRTNKIVFLDWNPVSEFWWYTEILPHHDVDFIKLTYKDNEALPQAIVQSIESKQHMKQFWQVYGLGELGEAEGRIYKGWQVIDEIPHEARLERYGLDFGYSNDPTAIDAIYRYNGGFIIDEITHQKGLANRQIADILNSQELKALTIADSAEPKSIDEIISYGVSVAPALKGQGSILKGIQYVQSQRISITKRSINALKEYRNYLWLTDPDGKIINDPSPIWNHHMDAIRYAINSMNVDDSDEWDLPDDTAQFRGGFY